MIYCVHVKMITGIITVFIDETFKMIYSPNKKNE